MRNGSKHGDRPRQFWDAFQPDARIDARTFRKDVAAASAERRLIFLRPPQDDDPSFPDPDEDPPPEDPCAGKPFVHAPLVAAQIDLGFGANEPRPCPSPADSDRIAAAVRRQLGSVVPRADVRVDCRPPILTIAVWEPFSGDPCELQARLRALDRLDLLEGDEAFGFLVRASLISSQAARAFALAPKQYDGVGAPSRFGSIHLTGLSVEFRPPDTVVTRISGYDDRPLPDVGFALIITDVIDEHRPEIDPEKSTRDTDVDDEDVWKAVLSALLLGLGGVLLTPLLLPAVFFVLAGDIDAARSANNSSGVTGVGQRALGLVPRDIPLPGRKKLSLSYGRSEVTKAAMFFGGFPLEEARQPGAAISGPAGLVIGDDARDVSAEFRLAVADTFGTLSIVWQSDEGLTVERPNSRETKVTFRRGDLTAQDPPVRRTLHATVADEDGFQAELTHTVDIFVADNDGLPPICAKHPELPLCRPSGPGDP